jgi:nucleoside-diphosphate-sugar epimerase
VTGCAGFIGSTLGEALVARGDRVLGIDSFSDYYPREVKERNLAGLRDSPLFEFREGDLAMMEIPLPEGCDGIFHLAAQAGVRGSWGTSFRAYVLDNVLATQRVFERGAAAGIRVVWASSSSIYGNAESYPTPESTEPSPISPYGVTKLTCEHLARAYARSQGLDAIALRYFTVYGPRQRPDMAFTRIALALADGHGFSVLGTGEQTRDVTFVGDAVSATLLAMARGRSGAAYNIGGGNEISLMEVIRLAERLSGTSLAMTFSEVAAGDVARTGADTTAARTDLGWAARTGVEEGIRRQLVWAGAIGDD